MSAATARSRRLSARRSLSGNIGTQSMSASQASQTNGSTSPMAVSLLCKHTLYTKYGALVSYAQGPMALQLVERRDDAAAGRTPTVAVERDGRVAERPGGGDQLR